MALSVLDTSIALPATVSRRTGLTRKLWALLAYCADPTTGSDDGTAASPRYPQL